MKLWTFTLYWCLFSIFRISLDKNHKRKNTVTCHLVDSEFPNCNFDSAIQVKSFLLIPRSWVCLQKVNSDFFHFQKSNKDFLLYSVTKVQWSFPIIFWRNWDADQWIPPVRKNVFQASIWWTCTPSFMHGNPIIRFWAGKLKKHGFCLLLYILTGGHFGSLIFSSVFELKARASSFQKMSTLSDVRF